MNSLIISVDRRDGATTLIVNSPPAADGSGPRCERIQVVETRADDRSPVLIGPGDFIRVESGNVLWTPRRSLGSKPEHVVGVDFDIALG